VSPSRSQRAFLAVVGITLVISVFTPARWLRPCTGAMAGIVSVPVQPFGDFALRVRNWIWTPDDPLSGESDKVRLLTEQLEMARQLAHARQLQIEALEEEMRELTDARRFDRGQAAFETLFARITGRHPDSGGGLLRLNRGSRDGVRAGAVAVFRGGHLIGRVAADVGRLASWLVPVTDPETGLLEVVVLPADDDGADLQRARLQLEPDGNGGLVGELPREVTVNRGDIVEVADPTWPESAWGLKVGVVDAVSVQENNPLRNQVRVVPRFPAHRLASVTLKIERPSSPS
jgi:cell shape-determining protein MreC